jgi:hypothetical protein
MQLNNWRVAVNSLHEVFLVAMFSAEADIRNGSKISRICDSIFMAGVAALRILDCPFIRINFRRRIGLLAEGRRNLSQESGWTFAAAYSKTPVSYGFKFKLSRFSVPRPLLLQGPHTSSSYE